MFRDLARRKGCEIEEGHVMSDHVHMLIAIPPKYAVSQVIGYMKGKAAIYIARNFCWEEAKFRRSAILGTWILCLHGGSGRRNSQAVYKKLGG